MIRACVVVALVAGCLQPGAVVCGDGRVCPAGTTCAAEHQLCLVPGQTEACAERADGDPCSFGVYVGICDRGVCVASTCGNGTVEAGESCDDGNLESGDGCRSDCHMCGDKIVDDGEQCDDGNANPVDGCNECREVGWTATPIIGGAPNATTIGLASPRRTVIDRHGNIFVIDTVGYRVRRIAPNGVVTTVAGNGDELGPSPDGVPATSVSLPAMVSLAVDGLGNLYIAQYFRVRRVDTNGIITTVAGTGVAGFSGDNGPATTAQISQAEGLAVDGLANVYIADTANQRVRWVDPQTGIIRTIAGTGVQGYGGDNGPGAAAQLALPAGLALTADALYIADRANHRVRRIALDGTITTVAGNGTLGFADGTATGTAMLRDPQDIAVDADGTLYIADTANYRIRRVAGGMMSTIAGSTPGFAGDSGPAVNAQFVLPTGVMLDGANNLYIADQGNHRIRKIDTGGTITTIAGSGTNGYFGDGQSALSTKLNLAYGIAVDAANNVYYTDTYNNRVRRVAPDGVVTTFAGNGRSGYAGDGGAATDAQLNVPYDVEVDGQGNVFIADTKNNRIRRVDTQGKISTVAGAGDELLQPKGVAVRGSDVFVADTEHHRVVRVDGGGAMTTIAGTGVAGLSGDGNAATGAQLRTPHGIAFDSQGNLYIADAGNNRIRRVDVGGTITTVAGTTQGFSGDGNAATSAQLDFPTGVAFGPSGELYIADQSNNRVRRVASGTITTIAGSDITEFSGDGGSATAAGIQTAGDVAVDAGGTVYVTDVYNGMIRRIAGGKITTVAGRIDTDDLGPVARARLSDPQALVITSAFTLFAGGANGTVLAARKASAWLEVVAGRYAHRLAVASLARFRARAFGSVGGIAYDAASRVIYVTETTQHQLHAITIVDEADETTWTIAALGAGAAGSRDGELATARFRSPTGLFFDEAAKQLYVADTGNHVVRVVDLVGGVASATVRTVAGVPETRGFAGDGQAATAGLLYEPRALTRCPNGDLFIADTGNHRVRRVDAAATISTVVGDGVAGSSGEGAPANAFPVHGPAGVACDAAGNVFVTSTNTVRLLPASDAGVVDGTGAVRTIYGIAPRETFPANATTCLTGIAVADAASMQVTDACAGLLVELRLDP